MAKATKDIQVGFELPPISKVTKLHDFSDWEGQVHTKEGAEAVGLQEPIIPGMALYGYMIEMQVKFFGERWLSEGKIEGKFIAPVKAGEHIITKGVVKEKAAEGNKVRLVIDTWCERPDGQKVAVGTASCLVS